MPVRHPSVSRETYIQHPHMTDPGIIFQRTHTGREEIHKKSHGLTQSERLVLIMVDGVSTYKDIRAKLPVLTDERFERALQKLQLKELVLEVFMPLDGQAPDELERTVIDRFLQQDPMDPLTVILHDPEDELGMLSHARDLGPAATQPVSPMPESVLASAEPANTPEEFPTLTEQRAAPPREVQAEPALDAQDVLLADALSAELKAKWAAKPTPVVNRTEPVRNPIIFQQPEEVSPFTAVHWGYWLIVSGISFIIGFVLARLTA